MRRGEPEQTSARVALIKKEKKLSCKIPETARPLATLYFQEEMTVHICHCSLIPAVFITE